MKKRERRTGYRKPKKHLKVWSPTTAPDLTKQLTPRLYVSMVDEEIPVAEEVVRKSWYLGLTQPASVMKKLGSVWGLPKSRTVLLFEDDVLALVAHLFNAGLVQFSDDGQILNGPEEEDESFKPENFKREMKNLKARLRRQKRKKK